jgi:hypothetical protein
MLHFNIFKIYNIFVVEMADYWEIFVFEMSEPDNGCIMLIPPGMDLEKFKADIDEAQFLHGKAFDLLMKCKLFFIL